MNLMDMLSTDATVYQSDDPVASFYDEVLPTRSEASGKPTIYRFPTRFSNLQSDLSEAVVQMFSSNLKSRLSSNVQRTSISNLLEPSESMLNGDVKNHSQDDAAACSIMFNSLTTISMHPSLLVDHFIPKGLLLSSTKASLSSQSGKLLLADKLINMISEKFDVSNPRKDFNMLVVAKSIKELELVEGLVIGKKLRYKNVSTGKSLYEEDNKTVKNDAPEDEITLDHVHKRREKSRLKTGQIADAEFQLKLITSSHLCSSYSSDIQFDLILSFDAELDTSAPSLDLLRSKSMNYIVPIIILVPVFSIEHIMRLIPKPEMEFESLSSETEAKWQLEVLSAFVVNRQKLYDACSIEPLDEFYAKNETEITDWLMDWQHRDPPSVFKTLDEYSKEVELNNSQDVLRRKLEENHLDALGKLFKNSDDNMQNLSPLKFDNGLEIDYATSRKNLAKFVALRKNQVERLIQKGTQEVLPRLRAREARRQERIDHDEDQIGDEYRKLRKLNEEVAIADRKFNRVETEHHKLSEMVSETSARKQQLMETLEKDDEQIGKITEEQSKTIKKLEEERDILQREKEALVKESEAVREEYQAKSTEAVKQTSALQQKKEEEARLRRKLMGPGMKLLPSLARRDELATFEGQMDRVRKENGFIQHMFSSQYEKIIKERSAMLESSVQGGSSSRTTNRISRASTPF